MMERLRQQLMVEPITLQGALSPWEGLMTLQGAPILTVTPEAQSPVALMMEAQSPGALMTGALLPGALMTGALLPGALMMVVPRSSVLATLIRSPVMGTIAHPLG
jgi:hypothetical protein